MIVIPTSFDTIDFTSPYFPAQLQLSYNEAIINAHQRPDGVLVDYNYGYDNPTSPTPFSMDLIIQASTEHNLFNAEEDLTNAIGTTGVFEGESPGGQLLVRATVTLRGMSADLTGNRDPLILPVTLSFFRWTNWVTLPPP